jgi:hypothetical protein
MMSDKIVVENKGFEELQRQFANSPKKLEQATRLAANTAMRQAQTNVKRGLTEISGAKNQKFLKERRRLFLTAAKKDSSIITSGVSGSKSRDAFASLWIGLNAVPAREIYWGKARAEAKGASLGDYYFEGGWIGFRTSKLGAGIYKRIGPDRFPIKLQGIEIDSPEVRAMIDRVVDVTEARYANEVARLLNVDWDQAAARSSK